MATSDLILPTPEELKVDEINLTTPYLKATAVYLGKYCDDLSKEFMLCKREERDPRACLEDGKKLTVCGIEFYKKAKKSCLPEMNAYSKCLEWNSGRLEHRYCKPTQKYIDQCFKEKLNIERPELGYFSKLRVHKTNRPKPTLHVPEFPNSTDHLPENYEKKQPIDTPASFI